MRKWEGGSAEGLGFADDFVRARALDFLLKICYNQSYKRTRNQLRYTIYIYAIRPDAGKQIPIVQYS